MFSSQRLFFKNYVNSTGRCSAHKLALMKFLVNPLSSKSCSRADSWFSMTGDLWCLIFSLSFLTCAEANLTIVFIIWLYFPYYITVWCMRWQKIRGIVCSDFPSTRYLKRLYSLKVKSFVSFFLFSLSEVWGAPGKDWPYWTASFQLSWWSWKDKFPPKPHRNHSESAGRQTKNTSNLQWHKCL